MPLTQAALLQPCTACAAGTFAASTNSTVCSTCPAGSFAGGSASTCQQCGPGYNAAVAGSASCSPCGPGFFQPLVGAATCTPCRVGSFAATSNATACHACAAGFSTNGQEGASACARCPPGTLPTSLANNITVCQDCPPGTYAPEDAGSCSLCPRGYYSDVPRSTSCTRCGSGTTVREAANSSLECVGFSSSRVTFATPIADALTNISVEFIAHMPLVAGESVWLALPGFSLQRADGTLCCLALSCDCALAGALTGASSSVFAAHWHNATEERPHEAIRLRVTAAIAPLTRVSLTVAASGAVLGVRLPMMGLRRCRAAAAPGGGGDEGKDCLSLSTDAVGGAVDRPVPVEDAPLVGSFAQSSTLQW